MLNTERDVKRVKERNRKRGEKGEETCGGNGRRPDGIAAMKRGEILALYGGPECGGSAVYGVWPMEPGVWAWCTAHPWASRARITERNPSQAS